MSGLFADHPSGRGPRFYQAPPGLHLSRSLARGLMRRLGGDPAALARATIFVGTRRAARALREAFAHEARGPVLTPRILAFPDLSPPAGSQPAAPPLSRLLILARLIRALAEAAPDLAREAAAAVLAEQIAALLDEMQAAGIDPQRLKGLAPEDHAAHWAESLRFLDLIGTSWPLIRESRGWSDAEALRSAAMDSRIRLWSAPGKAPSSPVLVVGETGRTALERDFIRAVALLPQGAAILPWLDSALGAEEWRGLEDHPEHPSADAAALLGLDGVPRETIPFWEPPSDPSALDRARLLGHALRPPPFTDAWRAAEREISALAPSACAELSLIEARNPREESAAVAALMRRILAEPERTVALVTPDRALGRRVAAALARWGIFADDSGGRPLALTPPGIFMRLLAQTLCVEAGKAFSATDFLSLMKHPLVFADEERKEAPKGRRWGHLRLARRYELFALRGRRTAPGLRGLRRAIAAGRLEAWLQARGRSDPEAHRQRARRESAELRRWFGEIEALLAPFAALAARPEVDFAEFLAAHRAAALALSAGATERGPTGEALARFLDRLTEAAPEFGPVSPEAWPSLFADLLKGEAARSLGGGHRRAFVWGPADARAQSADVVILAGLNEGVWPEIPQPDGWLSRPMRRDLGLQPLEASVGRLAQDFTRILCGAREVWLTRARKQGGAPASASRWLRRLEILLGGFAAEDWAKMRARGDEALRAALAIEADPGPARPEPRPAPRPPLRRRPLRLSATRIEILARDPYAVYARSVLGLSALPPLDPEPDALMRGGVFHQAIERFTREILSASPSPEEALAIFGRNLDEALKPLADRPTLQEGWRARGLAFAESFVPRELERRAAGDVPRLLEVQGEWIFTLSTGRRFKLTAKADRIDETPEGWLLIDYKTGSPPDAAEIRDYARQLPLEGAILRKGGFPGLERAKGGAIRDLRHVTIKPGAEESGLAGMLTKEKLSGGDPSAFSDQTLLELEALLEAYEKEETPYPPRLRPKHLSFASDYDHLARFGEWGGEGEEEDQDAGS